MKFGYTVKFNGEYYPPGTEVPMGDNTPVVEDKKEEKDVSAEKVVKRGRPKN